MAFGQRLVGLVLKNDAGKERYRLVSHLDGGGFGDVYEAEDVKIGRKCAVKVVSPNLASDFDHRQIRREVRSAAQLQTRKVVQYLDYDHDEQENLSYIIMEYLNGRCLEDLGPFPLDDEVVYRLVRDVCEGLGKAHENEVEGVHQPVIHRDLKPKNIMLVDEGTPDERFVLIDFGIAGQMGATHTLQGNTMAGAGTPEYMPMEQLNGEQPTPKFDIYALGVILYRVLTGELPYPNTQGTLWKYFQYVTQNDPPSFQAVAVDHPVSPKALEVEEIVQRCLCKDPEQRPASVREIQARFEEVYAADLQAKAEESKKSPSGQFAPDQRIAKLKVPETPLDDATQRGASDKPSPPREPAPYETSDPIDMSGLADSPPAENAFNETQVGPPKESRPPEPVSPESSHSDGSPQQSRWPASPPTQEPPVERSQTQEPPSHYSPTIMPEDHAAEEQRAFPSAPEPQQPSGKTTQIGGSDSTGTAAANQTHHEGRWHVLLASLSGTAVILLILGVLWGLGDGNTNAGNGQDPPVVDGGPSAGPLQQVEKLLSEDRFSAAIEKWQTFEQDSPKPRDGWQHIAEGLKEHIHNRAREGHYRIDGEAQESIAALRQIEPALIDRDQLEEAIRQIGQEKLDRLVETAQSHAEEQRYAEAIHTYQDAIGEAENLRAALGDNAQLDRQLSAFVQRQQHSVLQTEAEQLLAEGDYAAAIDKNDEMLTDSSAKDPQRAAVFFNRIRIRREWANSLAGTAEAREQLQQATRDEFPNLNAPQPGVEVLLAQLFNTAEEQRGRDLLAGAICDFRAILTLPETSFDSQSLGRTENIPRNKEQIGAALGWMEQAAAGLGFVAYEEAQKADEAARADAAFLRAIHCLGVAMHATAECPEFYRYYRGLARAFLEAPDFAGAIADLRSFVDHFEPDSDCAGRLTRVAGGNPQEVLALARSRLAWLLATAPEETLRDGRQALENAKQALETLRNIPQTPDAKLANVQTSLAAAQAEAGNFEEAQLAARFAKATLPKNGAARQQLTKMLSAFAAQEAFHVDKKSTETWQPAPCSP